MKIIISFFFLFLVASCQQKETNKAEFVETQIKNWKQQLVINGDIGQPCTDNTEKWSAENPEQFYGLPKDSINSKSFDANNDKIDDLLLYFSAGDCCSCDVGMNQASDYLKLIYSNANKFLSNDNLREKIATKIESEFYTQTNTDVERAVFSVTGFNKEISGTYRLWIIKDPDCCPSIEGTFKYNPFTFNIQITFQNGK